MTRERRGQHEAPLPPLTTDHATIREQARRSLLTHPGYQPRHRKPVT
jgi:hypothetical protein